MKTVLVSIDSKYIHTNLAVRYLIANTTYPVILKEFLIKDSIESIIHTLLSEKADCIAFSCYIWNIEMIKEITKRIREECDIYIIYGGPEVSYQNDEYLENHYADFILEGEGEISFQQLLEYLHKEREITTISGIKYIHNGSVIHQVPKEIMDLSQIKSPYRMVEDIPHIPNKIQYIETSRGCPFHCSYCLASLEKSVRFFDIEYVKEEMMYLISHGAKTFKFLDRTFNINTKYALDLFDFIIKHSHSGMSFQFEITGDILQKELVDFLHQKAPKNLFRFEIGVQSTNIQTNLAVSRKQNNEILFNNIKTMVDQNIIDLHVDLIAGLPYETLDLFKATFNQTFSLYVKELQLGFLKFLKGTKIMDDIDQYEYQYHPEAPYEIIQNQFLTKEDISTIHHVEEILELYWNKGFMNHSIQLMTEKCDSVFDLFLDIYQFLVDNHFNFHRYQLHEVFQGIDEYVKQKDSNFYSIFHDELIKEYIDYHPIKPKMWFQNNVEKKKVVPKIMEINPSYTIDQYYKYGLFISYQDNYYIVLYFPNNKTSFLIKKALVDFQD